MHDFSEKKFPEIDIGDFILREKQDDDVEDFFNYFSDPEVNRFILCAIPGSVEETKAELHYWRNVFYRNDGIYFALATKDENKMIGSIGLSSRNSYNNRIELSYDLAKEYWRKGITSKAIKAVIDYGFKEMNINRIEAFTAVENIPSKNLLLKCQFTLEGILRQHRYHKGRFFDVYSFSLLKSDLPKL